MLYNQRRVMYSSINNQRARQKRLFLRVNKPRPIKLP